MSRTRDRKTPDCVTAEAALCTVLSLNANRLFSKLNYPEWKVERELKALCRGLGDDSAAMRAVLGGWEVVFPFVGLVFTAGLCVCCRPHWKSSNSIIKLP